MTTIVTRSLTARRCRAGLASDGQLTAERLGEQLAAKGMHEIRSRAYLPHGVRVADEMAVTGWTLEYREAQNKSMTESKQTLLDQPAVSGCYLFPQNRFVPEPFVVDVGGAELACYHRVVQPDNYTVVHFHGNGEAVADYVPDVADEFARLNLNSLFVEYREYGKSTGDAQLVAMLADGQATIHAARLDPGKVIAFGRSIGSLYAIELAQRENLAGLILESGIADPSERFLTYAELGSVEAKQAVLAESQLFFNHEQKLSNYSGPLLVLHTENDGLVDISHAERNFAWSAGQNKRLVRFPVGDHNTIMAYNQSEYFRTVAEFVMSLSD